MRIQKPNSTKTLKEHLKEKVLTEVYQKSDKVRCLKFFEKLQQYLKDEISKEEFDEYKQKEHFDVVRIPQAGIGGYYEISTSTIVIILSETILDIIPQMSGEDKYELADYFWASFVHEDTHFQQQSKIDKNREGLDPIKICKQYIKYDEDLPYDLDIKRNVQYFSQGFEVDALAREIGEKLKVFYDLEGLNGFDLHKTIRRVFDDIKNGKLEKETSKNKPLADEVKKIVNIYWDPRIAKKAKVSFFKTLFEYLYDKETF